MFSLERHKEERKYFKVKVSMQELIFCTGTSTGTGVRARVLVLLLSLGGSTGTLNESAREQIGS